MEDADDCSSLGNRPPTRRETQSVGRAIKHEVLENHGVGHARRWDPRRRRVPARLWRGERGTGVSVRTRGRVRHTASRAPNVGLDGGRRRTRGRVAHGDRGVRERVGGNRADVHREMADSRGSTGGRRPHNAHEGGTAKVQGAAYKDETVYAGGHRTRRVRDDADARRVCDDDRRRRRDIRPRPNLSALLRGRRPLGNRENTSHGRR